MKVALQDLTISFYQKKILKNINFVFEEHSVSAITGANGSGKSTVVKAISGSLSSFTGNIHRTINQAHIEPNKLHTYINWVAPYINVYEELDVVEIFNFQKNFKRPKYTLEEFLNKAHLKEHRNKRIKYYSSGMKQRLKLALAMFFYSDLLLLDEPTVNLDLNFQNWYLQQLEDLTRSAEQSIIIASNVSEEYALATQVLNLEAYR